MKEANYPVSDVVRRTGHVLRADPRRVIAMLFLPGQELLMAGESRAVAVIDRVLSMDDAEVDAALARATQSFSLRHHDLEGTLEENFSFVAHRLSAAGRLSRSRRLLIGSYFTREYAVEAAALFNPSMVPHPDQSGLPPGALRFVMSARAVGEGHLSSIEFRTGVVSADQEITFDEVPRHAVAGRASAASYNRNLVRHKYAEFGGETESIEFVLSHLPEWFTRTEMDSALAALDSKRLIWGTVEETVERIRWIEACNYSLVFPESARLAERVIGPSSPAESNGLEDARFVKFTDEGTSTYYATYTAFDGAHVAPHLIRTDDFRTFEVSQLAGPAAKNKGMALFPRKIDGEFVALSRWDRESNAIATSRDALVWGEATMLQSPEQDWEMVQLGNCGSPIETEKGWLVLTHGVGPMRVYGIGAMMLDLDDPTKVIGKLQEPLMWPNEDEREGYVPNVLYSCGAMLHGETMVLPYGCSDSSIRVALVELPGLFEQLGV